MAFLADDWRAVGGYPHLDHAEDTKFAHKVCRLARDRVVDFAAGLIFGLRGSIERGSNRVFLLSPADTEVVSGEPAAHRSDGFFNQS